MSTLTDAVAARYSNQRLLEWTRPDDPNATTVDSTRLGLAGTDAESRFEVEVGVEFDSTDARHLQAAIPGVRAFLLLYLDQGAGQKAIDAWIKDHLDPLSKVTGRDRLSPRSSSYLQPTVEGLTSVARPAFDLSAFDGMNLENPSTGEFNEDD